MALTDLERRTIALLAERYHQLTPVIEAIAELELEDVRPTCAELAALGLQGLALANLLTKLDDAVELSYDALMVVSKALRANDLVAVASGTVPSSWEEGGS